MQCTRCTCFLFMDGLVLNDNTVYCWPCVQATVPDQLPADASIISWRTHDEIQLILHELELVIFAKCNMMLLLALMALSFDGNWNRNSNKHSENSFFNDKATWCLNSTETYSRLVVMAVFCNFSSEKLATFSCLQMQAVKMTPKHVQQLVNAASKFYSFVVRCSVPSSAFRQRR